MRSVEAASSDLLHREVVLFARDGGGRDAAAVLLGGMDGQSAPAGADLHQVVAAASGPACGRRHRTWRWRPHAAWPRRAGRCRRSRPWCRRASACRARCPGRSARRCCARCRCGCCGLRPVQRAAQRVARPRAPTPLSRPSITCAVQHHDADQRGQVVALPVALDIGLAGTHRAAEGSQRIESGSRTVIVTDSAQRAVRATETL